MSGINISGLPMPIPSPGDILGAGQDASARVSAAISNIWNARLIGDCRVLYADNARLHASARPDYDGVDAIERFYM